MQGDFTDQPESLPELMKRFEGGADIVVGERPIAATTPPPVKLMRRLSTWAVRPFLKVEGVQDPFETYRLYRISLIRDLLKERPESTAAAASGWATNAVTLARAAKLARRVETVALEPRYDLRPRESRIRPWSDAYGLFRFSRAAKVSNRGGSQPASP
jgi:hypothetical protein